MTAPRVRVRVQLVAFGYLLLGEWTDEITLGSGPVTLMVNDQGGDKWHKHLKCGMSNLRASVTIEPVEAGADALAHRPTAGP